MFNSLNFVFVKPQIIPRNQVGFVCQKVEIFPRRAFRVFQMKILSINRRQNVGINAARVSYCQQITVAMAERPHLAGVKGSHRKTFTCFAAIESPILRTVWKTLVCGHIPMRIFVSCWVSIALPSSSHYEGCKLALCYK